MKPSDNDRTLNSQELMPQKQAKVLLGESASLTVSQLNRLSSEEKQLLLDELQTHHVQMNMQNEELCLLQTALDAAHSRYLELYNQASLGYCTVSRHGLILQININASNLLGMMPSEMINERFSQYILKEDMGIHHHHSEQLKLSNDSQSYELRMTKKDGTIFWVQLLGTAEHSAKGSTEFRYILKDTSKRRHTDKALVDSGYKFLLLSENITFGLADCKMIYDELGEPIDYQFLDVNPAYIKMMGINPGYKTATQVFPDIREYSFDWIGAFAYVAKTGNQIHFERFFQFNNRWYDCIAYQSKIDHFVVMFMDITERKAHEEKQWQYTEQISRYADEIKEIYEYAPCGYYSIDKNGYFLHINKMALQWLGYRKDEIVNVCRLQDLLSGATLEDFEKSFLQLQKYGQERDLEVELIRRDGTVFPVLISSSTVYDQDGNYLMSRSTLYDMTERKKMEEERIQYAKQQEMAARHLVASQEHLRQQLSSELHDRTSPNLAAIAINLKVIASELQPEHTTDFFDRMEDTLALIADTTTSIREICTDMRPPLLDYAGLAAAIETYVQQFKHRTGIEVQFHCLNQSERYTPELESLLFRICQEALTNCLKHAAATSIVITLNNDRRPITLIIMDNGIGFDAEQLGMHGCAGLGLLSMREMTEIMGGSFFLESALGKGTQIKVVVL